AATATCTICWPTASASPPPWSSGRSPGRSCGGLRSDARSRLDGAARQRVNPAAREEGQMRFVLIHGGFHGAWCWARTIPELEKLGHEAIAIDLPGHGERRDESSLLHERAGAIVEAMKGGDIL